MTTTALELPHTPIQLSLSGLTHDDPNFVDVCPRCWTEWPCLPAFLAGLPDTRSEAIDRNAQAGPYDTEAPF